VNFSREIRNLLLALLIGFAMVSLSAGYWALVGKDGLLARDDNPRNVEQETRLVRGRLYDRNGTLLVESMLDENGRVQRNYLFPALHSAIGYASLRYGVGGIEAAYDQILRGDDRSSAWQTDLFHIQQQGSDLQLTLDLTVQQALWDGMQGQQGAAIAISVPDGEVLALVSLPTFDPDQLDDQWDVLTADPSNPFFNRALQGQYQPGGEMQTPLMIAALLTNQPLDLPIVDGTAPYPLDDLEITCAVRLPIMSLNLSDGYAFACPRPLVTLSAALGDQQLLEVFDQFSELQTIQLLPTSALSNTATPSSLATLDTPATITYNVLGQGDLTATPLSMAILNTAIINDGNAPTPYLVSAVRPPDSGEWIPIDTIRPPIPITTSSTARQMQDLMRYTVVNGAAQNAGRPNLDIGGHASLAYSGDTTLAWFTGFTTLGGRRGVAIAIVLENSSDVGLAADIGGATLVAAQTVLSLTPP
jgi:peptidoglycan glycosyltransferase